MAEEYLILHGWQNHRPEGHWQRWLAGELESRGARVRYPQLPEPDEPVLDDWIAALEAELRETDPASLTVVAHSLGCLLWLAYAARRAAGGGDGPAARRIVLVAPAAGTVLRGIPEIAAFAPTLDCEAARAALAASVAERGVVVAGTDDPYCPRAPSTPTRGRSTSTSSRSRAAATSRSTTATARSRWCSTSRRAERMPRPGVIGAGNGAVEWCGELRHRARRPPHERSSSRGSATTSVRPGSRWPRSRRSGVRMPRPHCIGASACRRDGCSTRGARPTGHPQTSRPSRSCSCSASRCPRRKPRTRCPRSASAARSSSDSWDDRHRVDTSGAGAAGEHATDGARPADGAAASVRALLDLRPYAFSDARGDGHWWILSDLGEVALGHALGEQHVLGVGGASLTLAGLMVPTPARTVLDLGTGCGIQAMHASRFAERIVATDISERALRLARLNVELNGIDGVEFRLGSLFEPVAGERFDRIVSNPPFVITPRAPGVPEYEYRDGGLVGDAIVEAVMRGAAEHLEPGGIAQLLGNWEVRDDEDGLRARPRLGRPARPLDRRARGAAHHRVRRDVDPRRRHAPRHAGVRSALRRVARRLRASRRARDRVRLRAAAPAGGRRGRQAARSDSPAPSGSTARSARTAAASAPISPTASTRTTGRRGSTTRRSPRRD